MPCPLQALTCQHCGREFMARRKGARPLPQWCSQSCVIKANPRGPRFTRETGAPWAIELRGTGTRGYVKRDGQHEHRVIMERVLGRKLTFKEVVHHKDGNKHNNDPSNLEVMTRAEHMRRHGLGVPGVPLLHEPWKKRWPRQSVSSQ